MPMKTDHTKFAAAAEPIAPDDQPVEQIYGRLREWVSDRLLGRCKMLSQGHACLCALCDLDRLRERAAAQAALSAPPQVPFDLASHLRRQAEWSCRTFGPGARVEGIIDHIISELQELRDSNGSLAEWIDVVILSLDGCWRSGALPDQIIDALIAKQIKNEGRKWPDWRTVPTDKAIEHDRSEDSASPPPKPQAKPVPPQRPAYEE
jgi:hypothetical protein